MKYIIIGNGTAGVDAALSIRKHDPNGEITIFTKSKDLHYFRPKLIDYLAGEIKFDSFVIYKEDFYVKKNIKNVLGTHITGINAGTKTVTDDRNTTYAYDKLLLATGGKPFVPPITGLGLKNVFTLRGRTDADMIMQCSEKAKNIIILGGGLLGLETANSLSRPGRTITVVEFAEWLLPRQLDREGAGILRGLLEKKGIGFAVNDSASSIEGGNGAVERVVFKSGNSLPADIVIISAGVRPDIDLAKKADIAVKGGIIVNDAMETSLPDIYAAGDAIEHNGRMYGIWPAAKEQGRIAGLNMAGVPAAYGGTMPSNMLKITGIDLYSAGDINHSDSNVYSSKSESSYKKLMVCGEKPKSTIVLGDKDAIKVAQKVMEGSVPYDDLVKLMGEKK